MVVEILTYFCAFLSGKVGGLFESYWVFLFPFLLSKITPPLRRTYVIIYLFNYIKNVLSKTLNNGKQMR